MGKYYIKKKILFIRNRILNELASIWIILIGILIIVIALILFLWKEGFDTTKAFNTEKVSQFGDIIGGFVGSIWSLAGIILFYSALKLQRKEFNLQRRELALQRNELIETRSVFKEQQTLMEEGQKESLFFHLIENHRNLMKTLSQSELTNQGTLIFNGYDLLEKEFTSKKKLYKECSNAVANNFGAINCYYSYHPDKIVEDIEKRSNIIDSSLTIIQFINDELKNQQKYHRILYNCLSLNEKILLGLYAFFTQNENRYSIHSANFDYLSYYKEIGFNTVEYQDFPYVQFSLRTQYPSSNFNELPKLFVRNMSVDYPIKVTTIKLVNSNRVVKELIINEEFFIRDDDYVNSFSEIYKYYFDSEEKLKKLLENEDGKRIKEIINEKGSRLPLYINFTWDSSEYVAASLFYFSYTGSGDFSIEIEPFYDYP